MSSQVKSSDTPDAIWQKIKVNQKVKNLTPLPLDTPIYPDKVRFVCMSDTHSNAEAFKDRIPNGDVFLHTGDFTYTGQVAEVEKFNKFLGKSHHYSNTSPENVLLVICGPTDQNGSHVTNFRICVDHIFALK